MTRYLDTSILVSLYTKENRSVDAQNWLDGLGSVRLAVSPWCVAEFSSALAIKGRRGDLTQEESLTAEAAFRRFVAGRTRVMEIITYDFFRASELCSAGVRLRAGDALHLSITERCGLIACTLDQGMWTAAQILNLPFETF